MKFKVNEIILFFLLIIWGTNLPTFIYYVIFILVFILALYQIVKYRKKIKFSQNEDYIALSFVLIWGYGIINGMLHENNMNYIVANFAGMICYIMYFIFTTLKLDKNRIIKIVFISGLSVSLIVVLRIVCFFINISNPIVNSIIGEGVGMSSTGQVRVYFTTLASAYPLLGASLFILLYQYRKIDILRIDKISLALLYFILTVSSIMFFASSKGFLLGALFIILYLPFFISVKSLLIGRLNKALFILLVIALIILAFLLYFDYFSIIEMMFAREDESNSLRYEQLTYMLKDITFWGKGLGATVPGIVRSEEGPYGFELTYINLLHKFGVFALVLFFNWIYMFIKLAFFMIKKKSLFYSSVALSSLGYMFPSIGNPLLMHPSLVILNCLTLYLLRIENGK
ncbi:hypothetical protein [Bacteroides sp. AM10-21B]|uniref:hypothetical protein n=1 Tax=Bacteroides sp. AM10-21B TaxID=2292001 RepID=UPI000E4CCFD9|nr:hypothetical protein [Bacteroides sp. AM10-21B]RHJ49822.1 hypothetical protein DW121_11730 [Bacteroides sp. AM10-21B]